MHLEILGQGTKGLWFRLQDVQCRCRRVWPGFCDALKSSLLTQCPCGTCVVAEGFRNLLYNSIGYLIQRLLLGSSHASGDLQEEYKLASAARSKHVCIKWTRIRAVCRLPLQKGCLHVHLRTATLGLESTGIVLTSYVEASTDQACTLHNPSTYGSIKSGSPLPLLQAPTPHPQT